MTKRLVTSDLHFDHNNIVLFTDRYKSMKGAGFSIPEEALNRYMNRLGTTEDKKLVVELHNKWLHQNVLNSIDAGDHVWHLGDFSFTKSEDVLREHILKLKGTWHFILGNHDDESKLRKALLGTKHILVGHYEELSVNKIRVCMLHYPMEEWNAISRGSWHLHGHLHGNKGHGDFMLKEMFNRMDVGLDNHPDHKLFNLEEIIK